jgi:hypothetical protein
MSSRSPRWDPSAWLPDPVLLKIILVSAWIGNEVYMFTDPHVRTWVAVPLTIGLTALTGVWVLLPLILWAQEYRPRKRQPR